MYQIFIVDDEIAIRTGMKRIIPWEEYGLEICGEASNGLEAFRYITEHQPDLVVCDIRMPVMDGLELIRQAHAKGVRSRFIVLSGHNDFDYVKEAIQYHVENYLLKPVNVDELKQTVRQVTKKLETEQLRHVIDIEGKEMIKHNVLNRIVHQQISSYEFKNKLELFQPDMRLTDADAQVAVIDFSSDDPDGRWMAPEMLREVERMCLSTIDPAQAIPFIDFAGRVVVIYMLRNGAPGQARMQRDLQNVYDRSAKPAGIRWMMTVGNAVSSYKLLHESYRNALDAQPARLYYNERDVIFYEEVQRKRTPDKPAMSMDYRLIEELTLECKGDELVAYIRDGFDRFGREEADPHSVRFVALEVVISLLRVLRAEGVAPSQVFEDEHRLLHLVNEFNDMERLLHWLLLKTDKTVLAIEARKASSLSKVTKDLLAYIDRYYHENFSLKSLAQEMHFNAVYMGRLFRNETGEVFSEYVTRVRIDKSLHLLRSTNKKVNEIARALGFNNANYYCAVFKERMGVTPTEYRNRKRAVPR
ncbi:response regulator transcription factor [Paenibacillus antri]|uniref:Response regulator transcription factor n=1 Tax=Paenibacillus antri TaxID=2582848 RepID=A0A5R9G6H8_9BACL|nr:response regulator transcription factor [Paenibacillus antri]TLS49118.1 response regulator transcription factor [Paenibacillus antri]